MSVNLYGVVYNPSSLVVIDNSGFTVAFFGFGSGAQVPTFEAMHPDRLRQFDLRNCYET